MKAYLNGGVVTEDKQKIRRITLQAPHYTMVKESLYRRGFVQPLLINVEPGEAEYIMKELHKGICGN